jgi:hypothetical protein
MSDSQCKSGDTIGFPVTLAQSLYTNWPATANAQQQIQRLIVPTDFSIQWQNNGQQTCSITVKQTLNSAAGPGVFQISGFNPDGCTITYGPAIYQCSGVISIVQNQHPNLTQGSNAQYEMILAFQIKNKNINPSSPDIILLCRPLIFQNSGQNTPFWNAVDVSTTQQAVQNNVGIDLSSFYGYNASMPMPMITYQSCLSVKRFAMGGQFTLGSLKIRVNVVPQPIYVVASETGLGKCSSINKYTLITTGNGPIDVFGGGSILQFRDGNGADLFPLQTTSSYLVPLAAPNAISALADVLQKFEILVPDAFLGKSLSDIANIQTPPKVEARKKAYKCYTIDPSKDIVGDQIMVDPTTGQSLLDTQKQEALDAAGGDTMLIEGGSGGSPGILPGDIEHILTVIAVAIGTLTLLAYLGFIVHMLLYRENGFHNSLPHILGFIVCFIGLVLFSVYVEKPTE